MAKKKAARTNQKPQNNQAVQPEQKTGNSLKDMLNEEMLSKLKTIEKDLKKEKEQAEMAEIERRQKEKAEKEKNKSFAELLEEFDKKPGGKYV